MAFDVRHKAAKTGRAAVKTTKQVGKTAAKVTKKAVLLPSKTLKVSSWSSRLPWGREAGTEERRWRRGGG